MTIPPTTPGAVSTSQPPRTALLTNITEQTSLLQQLFTVLTTSTSTSAPQQNTTPPGLAIPNIYASLQKSTEELKDITEGLWEHQRVWAEMKKKESEVRRLETQVRDLISELETGRRELESLIRGDEEDEEAGGAVSNPLVEKRGKSTLGRV